MVDGGHTGARHARGLRHRAACRPGVQLVGPAGADHAVLRLGRAYEEATQWVADYPPVIVS